MLGAEEKSVVGVAVRQTVGKHHPISPIEGIFKPGPRFRRKHFKVGKLLQRAESVPGALSGKSAFKKIPRVAGNSDPASG